MRALVGILLLALLSASAAVGTSPRVMVEPYFLGAGEAACVTGALGCALFYVEGNETTAHILVQDDTGRRVAFNTCSPTCAGPSGPFCVSGTVTDLRPGDLMIVYIHSLGLSCGLGSVPSKGTVTATFT